MPEAMSDAVLVQPNTVQPDTKFIRGVMAAGGGDLKKCYQCATCTSVCSLSDEHASFPRKQMIKAQWGLREQLVGDPAVWLCHDCGDCTTQCPRDARPSRAMAAIRLQVIRSCAFPAFMGAWFAQSLPVRMLIVIPSALLALAAMLPLRASPRPPYEFAALFPQARLEAMFFTISALVLIAYLVAMTRFVRALRAAGASGRILPALGPVLLEILLHRRFAKCDTKRGRNLGHMFVLLAFAGLALMGTMVGVGTMIGAMHTPLAMLNPLKLFANLCSALAVVGIVMLIVNRLRPEARALSASFDWSLLLTLGMIFATGLLSEALRLLQVELAMYAVYFIHLTLVFALFLNAPYGKFAHFFYRTVAMAATWEKPPRLELAASLSEPE